MSGLWKSLRAFFSAEEPLEYGTRVRILHGEYRGLYGKTEQYSGGEYCVSVETADHFNDHVWLPRHYFTIPDGRWG